MKHTLRVPALLTVSLGFLLAGCNYPPRPPRTEDGSVPDTLSVQPANEGELNAVVAMETARVNYRYRLEVLRSFFLRKGQMDQHEWATRELENLDDAHTFTWENVPQILPPQGESLADVDARVLVEYAVSARKAYRQAAADLVAFYERQDREGYKARRVRNVQERFNPVYTYMYFLEAEIPGPELRPVEVVPAADRLYDEAIRLYRSGRGPLGLTSYRKQQKALTMLLELVREHPQSTKIALAAYHIGEIYKEFFGENVRAVMWYQRAWEWDPHIIEPARFQAAVVYDLRLHNFAKAVDCYRLALQYDPWRLGNAETAERRIRQLTEQQEKTSSQVAPPAPPAAP